MVTEFLCYLLVYMMAGVALRGASETPGPLLFLETPKLTTRHMETGLVFALRNLLRRRSPWQDGE